MTCFLQKSTFYLSIKLRIITNKETKNIITPPKKRTSFLISYSLLIKDFTVKSIKPMEKNNKHKLKFNSFPLEKNIIPNEHTTIIKPILFKFDSSLALTLSSVSWPTINFPSKKYCFIISCILSSSFNLKYLETFVPTLWAIETYPFSLNIWSQFDLSTSRQIS